MTRVAQQNWFETLNAALESEGLVEFWKLGDNLSYGEGFRTTVEDGNRYRHISIYRENDGRYERPVHYDAGAINNNINRGRV